MCRELFQAAIKKYTGCPIRVFPRCHPHAHFDVFIDPKKGTITLCCSKCDRPLPTIRAKHENGTSKRDAGKGK